MVPESAREHYASQQALTGQAVAVALQLWSRVDPDRLGESWGAIRLPLVGVVAAAQAAAAQSGADSVPRMLAELDIPDDPSGRVNPGALAGVASDGRDLEGLLYSPVATARTVAFVEGAGAAAGVAAGREALLTIVATQVQDAGRASASVAVTSQRRVGGYVRMLNLPSCSRCIQLAGKWFRWNRGFDRHPRCDCVHIPANEDQAGDVRTDPRAAFDSLTRSEQDRAFTRAGAEAIRDGADIQQVVNARRGASGLSVAGGRLTRAEQVALQDGRERGRLSTTDVFGRQLATTTEGTTVRGVAGRRLAERGGGTERVEGVRNRRARAPRLMPEAIYEIAEDRADALRLLRANGYLL